MLVHVSILIEYSAALRRGLIKGVSNVNYFVRPSRAPSGARGLKHFPLQPALTLL